MTKDLAACFHLFYLYNGGGVRIQRHKQHKKGILNPTNANQRHTIGTRMVNLAKLKVE